MNQPPSEQPPEQSPEQSQIHPEASDSAPLEIDSKKKEEDIAKKLSALYVHDVYKQALNEIRWTVTPIIAIITAALAVVGWRSYSDFQQQLESYDKIIDGYQQRAARFQGLLEKWDDEIDSVDGKFSTKEKEIEKLIAGLDKTDQVIQKQLDQGAEKISHLENLDGRLDAKSQGIEMQGLKLENQSQEIKDSLNLLEDNLEDNLEEGRNSIQTDLEHLTARFNAWDSSLGETQRNVENLQSAIIEDNDNFQAEVRRVNSCQTIFAVEKSETYFPPSDYSNSLNLPDGLKLIFKIEEVNKNPYLIIKDDQRGAYVEENRYLIRTSNPQPIMIKVRDDKDYVLNLSYYAKQGKVVNNSKFRNDTAAFEMCQLTLD